jgi:hypothetical protein
MPFTASQGIIDQQLGVKLFVQCDTQVETGQPTTRRCAASASTSISHRCLRAGASTRRTGQPCASSAAPA